MSSRERRSSTGRSSRRRPAWTHDHPPGETCDTCLDPSYDPFVDIDAAVRRSGWAIQPLLGSPAAPPSAHTIGLCRYGMAELIIVGVEHEAAAVLLNHVARRARNGDIPPLEPGRRQDLVLSGYPSWLIPVLDPTEGDIALTFAVHYARLHGLSVKALQLVWCDDARRFPWDDGWPYADENPPRQPILGEVPDL